MAAAIIAAIIIGVALGTAKYLGSQAISAPKRKRLKGMEDLILAIEEQADNYRDIDSPLAMEIRGLIRNHRRETSK